MSSRGRSTSPRPLSDRDVTMDEDSEHGNSSAKVIAVNNLTRNVVEAHLRAVFSFYGEVSRIDLPLYGKSGQNRGKASVEFHDASSARQAVSHMNGGQLDGAVLKVELSHQPIRSRSRTPPRRNGRDALTSLSRQRSPSRGPRRRVVSDRRYGDSYRGSAFERRNRPVTDSYRPLSRSRSRSRSPIRRDLGRLLPRRRSPSYERGGAGYRGRRSRSRSYSVTSSHSRSRSYTPSRSRSRTHSRSRSYSSYSRYTRSRSRSRSYSRRRRSHSRDDIRDSRSRSP